MKRYLSLAEVVEINARVISEFGGIHQIRDQGLLEAAVARPATGYYADTVEEAAALFESLAQNHPFLDGNKRTAITAAAVFLILNNYKLKFSDLEAYRWLMDLFERGALTRAAVEDWFRNHVNTIDKP